MPDEKSNPHPDWEPLPAAAEEGAKVQAPSADGVKGKTWKTVDELSPEEKAMIDLRADTDLAQRDELRSGLQARKESRNGGQIAAD